MKTLVARMASHGVEAGDWAAVRKHERPALSTRPASGARFHQGHVLPSGVAALPSINTRRGNDISWAKIDDGYFDNDKVLMVSSSAKYLHLTSLIWAAGHALTGVLPKPVLRTLMVLSGMSPTKSAALAAELVGIGLWEDVNANHWLIHNYVPFIAPKQREKAAARLKDWREEQRQRNAGETPTGNAFQGAVKRVANASPVPSRPVPLKDFSKEVTSGGADAA